MGLDTSQNLPEHIGGYDMDFVEKDEPPLLRCQEIHHFLRFVRPIVRISDHRICRNNDAARPRKLMDR